ncbi:MAG: DUF4190 domain-containing protein [bacterium]|nr:DUF4190 domain-containing protein [bacterium]
MNNDMQGNGSSQMPDYGDRYEYPHTEPPKKRNGLAIASFILGLLGLLSCCCSPLGLILGVIGLILVILSKRGQPFDPFAVAGLVLSIIAIIASLISFVYYISVLQMMQDPEFNNLVNEIMGAYESLPIE